MMRGFNGVHVISHLGSAFSIWAFIAMAALKLLILGILIFFIVKFVKKHNLNFHSVSALKILNERFAKGEIDEEEYLKRKEVLQKK